jgi:hypothetical protein
MPDVQCLLITKHGRRLNSKHWKELEAPTTQPAPAGSAGALFVTEPGASGGPVWNSAFELIVNLELSRIEGQRAKRPYLAAWIEDEDNFPVRTLALWFAKPKWLPDLKSWSHSDRFRALTDATDIARSVSSATRSPGRYSLKWDGRDDHGQLVRPGRYTVVIEAAREHGTHQVMRQEMDFSGTPQKIELKDNVEISSASLDYRRKTDTP